MQTLEAINHCPWNHASLCAHIFHLLKRLWQYTSCADSNSFKNNTLQTHNNFIATSLRVQFCSDAELHFVCTNKSKMDTVYFRNRIVVCFDFLLSQLRSLTFEFIHSSIHINSADSFDSASQNFDSYIIYPWCTWRLERYIFHPFLLAWLVGNNSCSSSYNHVMSIYTIGSVGLDLGSNTVKMAFKKVNPKVSDRMYYLTVIFYKGTEQITSRRVECVCF